MAVVGYKDWKKVETGLIKKGNKESYDVVKSWRMIHLLATLLKVVDKIVLNKLTKAVSLEETENRSRKNGSTHEAIKQIREF